MNCAETKEDVICISKKEHLHCKLRKGKGELSEDESQRRAPNKPKPPDLLKLSETTEPS